MSFGSEGAPRVAANDWSKNSAIVAVLVEFNLYMGPFDLFLCYGVVEVLL